MGLSFQFFKVNEFLEERYSLICFSWLVAKKVLQASWTTILEKKLEIV